MTNWPNTSEVSSHDGTARIPLREPPLNVWSRYRYKDIILFAWLMRYHRNRGGKSQLDWECTHAQGWKRIRLLSPPSSSYRSPLFLTPCARLLGPSFVFSPRDVIFCPANYICIQNVSISGDGDNMKTDVPAMAKQRIGRQPLQLGRIPPPQKEPCPISLFHLCSRVAVGDFRPLPLWSPAVPNFAVSLLIKCCRANFRDWTYVQRSPGAISLSHQLPAVSWSRIRSSSIITLHYSNNRADKFPLCCPGCSTFPSFLRGALNNSEIILVLLDHTSLGKSILELMILLKS
jgi:hypothetical protein